MKKFKFKVTQIDKYIKEIEVEAESYDEAHKELENDLDECPLDTRSNTLESSETHIEDV